MPLTEKGDRILQAMKKTYGADKGRQVFYASQNKGRITGTHQGRTRGNRSLRRFHA